VAVAVDQTNVGTAADSGATTTLAVPATNAVAAGAWIFIGGVANAATVLSASGSSISWIVDTSSATTNAFASLIRGFAVSGVASGGTLATLTYSASDTGKIAVASSMLGLDLVNPLGTVGAGASASAQAWASTSMSPAAGDITIAVTSYFSSGGVTDGGTNTPSAGTTELNNIRNSGTDDEVVLSYRTTSGTVAGTFSTAASRWNCAVATYKAAAGGASPRTFNPIPFMSNGRL
jgi:hypothetical protein